VDEITREYFVGRVRHYRARGDAQPRLTEKDIDAFMALDLDADEGAVCAKEMELDLGTISPYVSGPNEVKNDGFCRGPGKRSGSRFTKRIS
jgi:aconitase A